jgi:hypothetical protein
LPAAGAKRAADSNFLRSRGGARQQEIRDIRAGDKVDENDRAHD